MKPPFVTVIFSALNTMKILVLCVLGGFTVKLDPFKSAWNSGSYIFLDELLVTGRCLLALNMTNMIG